MVFNPTHFIRKNGKLPFDKIRIEYDLEYGTDIIEIHNDFINEDDIVLIYDDLLATGVTLNAALALVRSFNPKQILLNVIIEIDQLNGGEKFLDNDLKALIKL